MATRDETVIKLFTYIHNVILEDDLEEIKKYIANAIMETQNEDDYVKALAVQLILTSYVRYVECTNYQEDDIILVENNDQIPHMNPSSIFNIAANVSDKCNDRVQAKIVYIVERFIVVPCVSKFFYNHKEYLTDSVRHLLYSEEDIDAMMIMSRAYNQYFYFHMIEFFTYKPYKDPSDNFKTVTKEKWTEELKGMCDSFDEDIKSTEPLGDLVNMVLAYSVYHYADKDVSLYTYYFVMKALEYYIKVEQPSKDEMVISFTNINTVIDVNFIIMLKGVARFNNKDDSSTIDKIEAKFSEFVRSNKIGSRYYDNNQELFEDTKKEKVEEPNELNDKYSSKRKNINVENKPKKEKKKKKYKDLIDVSHRGLFIFLGCLSVIQVLVFALLTVFFYGTLKDTNLYQQLLDIANKIIVTLSNDSFSLSSITQEQIYALILVGGVSTISCLINCIIFWTLSSKVDSESGFGKFLLVVVSLLYGVGKCPISTTLSSIIIYKKEDFFSFDSKFLKVLLLLLPFVVFILSIIYI